MLFTHMELKNCIICLRLHCAALYHVPCLHCSVVCRYPSVPPERGAGGGGWADPDPGKVAGEDAGAEQEAETAHHLDRWDIQWVIG